MSTSIFEFHSKNLQITSKLLTQGYGYHKRRSRKTFGKFFRSYSELLSKFCTISFPEYVSKGITHLVFYGELVYKLRRVKGEANFISSDSKIVKRHRRRIKDPAFIEMTIYLVLALFSALYRSLLNRCTLPNKAGWTLWRILYKPPQRRQCLILTSEYQEILIHTTLFVKKLLKIKNVTLLLGQPVCDVNNEVVILYQNNVQIIRGRVYT